VAALGVAAGVVVVADPAGVVVVVAVLSAAGVDGVVVVVVVLAAGTSTLVSVLAGASFLEQPTANAATVARRRYAFIVDPVVLCGKCCSARWPKTLLRRSATRFPASP
jgi:hypothetical protein